MNYPRNSLEDEESQRDLDTQREAHEKRLSKMTTKELVAKYGKGILNVKD